MASFSLHRDQMITFKVLTIGQLLKSTDSLRKSGSDDTIIKALRFTKTANGLIVAKAAMSSASRKHLVFDTWYTFTGLENRRQINAKSKVMVQCQCEDYMFVWEYANTAHNAARIFYSNGEAPDERNPAYRPGLCKHSYRLAIELITKSF